MAKLSGKIRVWVRNVCGVAHMFWFKIWGKTGGWLGASWGTKGGSGAGLTLNRQNDDF